MDGESLESQTADHYLQALPHTLGQHVKGPPYVIRGTLALAQSICTQAEPYLAGRSGGVERSLWVTATVAAIPLLYT